MFGWFKKDPLHQAIKRAKTASRAGEYREAFNHLRELCPDESIALDRKRYAVLMRAIEEVGASFDGPEFREMIAHAHQRPDDVEALYQAGCDLLDYGLNEFATLPLQRLLALEPDNAVHVTALVSAYEGLNLNERIVALLRACTPEVQEDPLCLYLLAFHEIMCGRIEQARPIVPELARSIPEDQHYLCERVTAMIARADAIAPVTGLGDHDLIGWHYVKTGGLLTHLSPFGFEEAMRGRYALYQETYDLCRYGLERLRQLLILWQLDPPRIYFGRDRSSRIMATAAAKLFDRPLEPLAQANGPGLIVIYDLDELEGDDMERIMLHHPGRWLFVHTLNWVDPPTLSADIVTYLHQCKTAPWAARLRVDPADPRTISYTDPDQRGIEEIAADVLAAEAPSPDAVSYDPDLAGIAAATRHQASIFREDGYRERYWQGGPVKSSRF